MPVVPRRRKLSSDDSAVAEVVGEILLTAIAVLAFAAIVTFIFSNLGPAESTRVDVSAWTDIESDTVYFRHTGGETVDVNDIELLVNINGTIERIDSSQISSSYNRDVWEFGDTIALNVSDIYGYNITENSSLQSKLVHTSGNLVVFDSQLSGSSSVSSGSGDGGSSSACSFAHWPFNTGSGSIAYDSVGSNDAVITGASWTTGVSSNALSFDGSTSDYVEVSMDLPTDEITVMFWMNSSDTSDDGTPFSYAVSSEDNEFLIFNYNSFDIYRDGSRVTTGVSATDGEWHHIAVTWNGSDGSTKLYKDGSLEYSGTLKSGTTIATGGTLIIGQEQDNVGGGFDSGQEFEGILDEVCISDRILSDSEIQDAYNANKPPEPPATPACNLAIWSFDNGSGTVAYESVSSNDGTIIGATWDSGVNGSSLLYDGTSSYVEIDDPIVTGYPFTVSVWIKTTVSTTDQAIVTLADSNSGNVHYGLFIDNPNGIGIRARNTATRNAYGTADVADGKWHHIVGVFEDDDERYLYVDGVLNASSTSSSTFNTNVDRWNAGRWADSSPSNYFNGNIDELCLTSDAMNATEVQQLYNSLTPPNDLSYRVSTGNDDAEERLSNGDMSRGSSDLNLILSGSNEQEIGMRFTNVAIPQGSTIESAKLVFTIDSQRSESTNLSIYGHDIDESPEFSNDDYNITSRQKTSNYVEWNNLSSPAVNELLVSPGVSVIVQEIVNRPGWDSGNSMSFMINGTGRRDVEAYNGESRSAPLLLIRYS